jgi:hypothetical protein
MKTLGFIWEEPSSLLERLSQPVAYLSIEQDVANRPLAVHLHHHSGIVTEISSQMHDIAPRTEVGVLKFSTVGGKSTNGLTFELEGMFFTATSIEKLVITEGEFEAESGLVLTYPRQTEIVIVASTAPYVLAIKLPWETPALTFSPEYPLKDYHRILMRRPKN